MASRKKFIEVEIPMINESVDVAGTPESLHKKTIKIDMSRKLRGKNLEIVFQVFNQEGTLIAYPKKIQLMKQYIRRITRKHTSYIEDSFEVKCTDIRCRIKPLLVTRKKVSRAVRNNLRRTTKEWLTAHTAEKKYMFICEDIIHGELQKSLLPKLKKIYPLTFLDLRIIETKELEKADFGTKPKEKEAEPAKEKTDEDTKEPAEGEQIALNKSEVKSKSDLGAEMGGHLTKKDTKKSKEKKKEPEPKEEKPKKEKEEKLKKKPAKKETKPKKEKK